MSQQDMTEDHLRELVCEIGRNLWTREMVAANDGNVSVRLPDAPDGTPGGILCTPTLVSKGYLRPDMLPVVALDGSILRAAPTGQLPSSEMKMHLRIYNRRSDVGAVVHAHPMFATSFAIRGRALTAQMMPESVVAMPGVPLAAYATPSTEALPDSIEPYIDEGLACLLEHHGALTWGPDLMSTYLHMERLEYTAKLTYLLEAIDGVRELPADEIARIQRLFGSY